MVRTQCFHCNDPGSIPGQATKLTRLLQLEKAQMQQWSLSTAKNEWIFKKINKAPPAPRVVQNPTANARDTSLIPGAERFHTLQGNWAHALQLVKPSCPRTCAPQQKKPLQ